MQQSLIHKTPWIQMGTARIRFEYGYRYLEGNESSYVFVTHQVFYNGIFESCGVASREQVATYFPKILPLVRWHLFGCDTGPMHYVANTKYWWDIVHGRDTLKWYYRADQATDPKVAREHLLKQIVYGALDDDWMYDPVLMPVENLETWLESRRERLVKQMHKDCDPIIMVAPVIPDDQPDEKPLF